jgi:hypothetical protein
MSFRTSVTIVASPRPRTGKTLLARLLIDFNIHVGRDVAAFDLNAGEGTLAHFSPALVTAAAIGDVKGEMALFDRLVTDDGVAKVVDLSHEKFEAFFDLARRLDFADEARRRNIAPSILFIATPDATSVEAYRKLGTKFPDVARTPVHNELLGNAQRDRYPIASGGEQLRFSVLAPGLRRYIEKPPFSFADEALANTRNIPLDVHIELQRWLRKIYAEFRDFDSRGLEADLASSVRT